LAPISPSLRGGRGAYINKKVSTTAIAVCFGCDFQKKRRIMNKFLYIMLNLNRSNFQAHPFHLVSPSPWPLYTSISLLSLTTSAVLSFHGFAFAEYNLMMSLITLILAMLFWWRDVIAEGTYLGNHTLAVQRGLNLGVGLFIVSEALFFLAIFFTWGGFFGGNTSYISEPMSSLMINGELKTSGFYTGKGKGKAIDVPEEEKPESPYKSGTDSEYDEDTRKAIKLSLQENNGESSKTRASESSKTRASKEDSPGGFDIDKLLIYIKDWKSSNDTFLTYAKLYNNLKIELDKQTVKSEKDLKLLSEYLYESNGFKLKRDKLEKTLLEQGINPSEQFISKDNSESESHSSIYSSDNTESSHNSNSRSRKRVKFTNENNNLDFPLGFIGLNLIPVVRILSCIVSALFVLIKHFNVLPNVDLWFTIDLIQFLTLFLFLSLSKLMYKWYTTAINLYNHYLNKDYMVIYFNAYFSIVTFLLYFSSNIDICIFYC
jgi:hypothetical protein